MMISEDILTMVVNQFPECGLKVSHQVYSFPQGCMGFTIDYNGDLLTLGQGQASWPIAVDLCDDAQWFIPSHRTGDPSWLAEIQHLFVAITFALTESINVDKVKYDAVVQEFEQKYLVCPDQNF